MSIDAELWTEPFSLVGGDGKPDQLMHVSLDTGAKRPYPTAPFANWHEAFAEPAELREVKLELERLQVQVRLLEAARAARVLHVTSHRVRPDGRELLVVHESFTTQAGVEAVAAESGELSSSDEDVLSPDAVAAERFHK